MRPKLRVGIVGLSRGGGLLPAFAAFPDTTVVALCDRNAALAGEKAAEAGGAAAFTDYGDMLDRAALDMVVVSTPMPLHVPQSVAALQRGVHVLSEVPAATDLEQCFQLAEAARAGRAQYMMGENYCYMRETVLVRAMAQAGVFGETYYGEGAYIHELKWLNAQTPWRRFWQFGIDGNTYPTHSLGPLLQWTRKRVETVACLGSGRHYRDEHGQPYENQDTTLTLCRLAGGGLVKLRLDLISERPSNGTEYLLQGTRGAYLSSRHDENEPVVWLMDRSPDKEQWEPLSKYADEFLPEHWKNPPKEALAALHGGGDYFVVRDFVDSIRNGTAPPIDVYAALDMTVPGLVSQESIRRGGVPLPVPDFRTVRRFPGDLPEELRSSGILRVSAPR